MTVGFRWEWCWTKTSKSRLQDQRSAISALGFAITHRRDRRATTRPLPGGGNLARAEPSGGRPIRNVKRINKKNKKAKGEKGRMKKKKKEG